MIPNLKQEFERAELIETAPIGITPRFDEPRSWYVLLTLPGTDKRAAEWMEKKLKLAIYWPNYPKDVRRNHGRRVRRTAAMIPGYIFWAASSSIKRPALPDCDDLRGFAKEGGEFAIVHEWEIKTIREIEGKLNLPAAQIEWTWQPAAGQEVVFNIGAFSGFHGIVFDAKRATDVGVEADIFGRKTRMYVSVTHIEPLDKRKEKL